MYLNEREKQEVERFGDLMDKETRDEKRLKARLTK
jgi:hypothetical protein